MWYKQNELQEKSILVIDNRIKKNTQQEKIDIRPICKYVVKNGQLDSTKQKKMMIDHIFVSFWKQSECMSCLWCVN